MRLVLFKGAVFFYTIVNVVYDRDPDLAHEHD